MSNNRKVLATVMALVTIVVLGFNGCTKDTTVYIEKVTVITKTVSFSKDLVPIFVKSCNSTGCHNAGAKKPDLSPNNAYNSLKNGKYYDTKSPEKSELYLWLTGKRALRMPMGAEKNPSSINELTLAWIKQGAKKN